MSITESHILLEHSRKLLPETTKLIQPLYNKLLSILNGKTINTYNIVSISINLMKFVELYPKLPGRQKKNIVLYVLNKFAIDYLDGEDETVVTTFIDLILPSMIDSVISIDRKELTIGITKNIKRLFTCCKKKSKIQQLHKK